MKCGPTITVDGDFTRRQRCQLSTIALPSKEVGSCVNRAVRPVCSLMPVAARKWRRLFYMSSGTMTRNAPGRER